MDKIIAGSIVEYKCVKGKVTVEVLEVKDNGKLILATRKLGLIKNVCVESHRVEMKTTHQYIIGIDPGGTTGLCVYHKPEKRIKSITSGTILDCIYTLDLFYKDITLQALIRIEDARLRKWIPRQKTESAERGRREGAGHVKAHCAIWEDYCKRNHIAYELVAPKNNKTKVTTEYFKKLTGWDKQTNNHERDAAMLVVGL